MQTFLPYRDFDRSAEALDTVRLRCQIKEGAQIMQVLAGDKGFKHHPTKNMWQGYETALLQYIDACAAALLSRKGEGHASHGLAYEWYEHGGFNSTDDQMPWWLGYDRFHRSHQANLRRKDPAYYAIMTYAWADPRMDGLEYLWPLRKQNHDQGHFQIGPKARKRHLETTRDGTMLRFTDA